VDFALGVTRAATFRVYGEVSHVEGQGLGVRKDVACYLSQ